jgi:putative phosphoesterase
VAHPPRAGRRVTASVQALLARTVAVLADTHLEALPPARPEWLRRAAEADLVLHAGDVTGAAALDGLERLGVPLAAVRGNVDDPDVRRRLPETLEIEVEGVRIALVHDAGPAGGRLERLRSRFPSAAAVVFGHSHVPLHEAAHGVQLFNPGSPTRRRRHPVRTMGIATCERGSISFRHLELP